MGVAPKSEVRTRRSTMEHMSFRRMSSCSSPSDSPPPVVSRFPRFASSVMLLNRLRRTARTVKRYKLDDEVKDNLHHIVDSAIVEDSDSSSQGSSDGSSEFVDASESLTETSFNVIHAKSPTPINFERFMTVDMELEYTVPHPNVHKPDAVKYKEAYEASLKGKVYPLLMTKTKNVEGFRIQKCASNYVFCFEGVINVYIAYAIVSRMFAMYVTDHFVDFHDIDVSYAGSTLIFNMDLNKNPEYYNSDLTVNALGMRLDNYALSAKSEFKLDQDEVAHRMEILKRLYVKCKDDGWMYWIEDNIIEEESVFDMLDIGVDVHV